MGSEANRRIESRPGAHVPALDGLRGLAILLVLLCHYSERFTFADPVLQSLKEVLFAGWSGVDLFFVLSGFLITGILWDAKGSAHYFRNFYMRRTVRIFPLYYAMLLFLFVILPRLSPLVGLLPNPTRAIVEIEAAAFASGRPHWDWFVLYLSNVLIARCGFIMPGHFWTLAVEEHFYLVWPLLVRALNRRALMAVSLGLVAAALALRIALVGRMYVVALYVLTPFRMDALAMGAFLALAARGPGGLAPLARRARVALAGSGAAWLALALRLRGWPQFAHDVQTLGYTITMFFYASLLVLGLTSPAVAAAFRLRPLRALGKYSYGIYVIHPFPLFLFAPFFSLGDAERPSLFLTWLGLIPGTTGHPIGVGLLLLDGLVYTLVFFGTTLALVQASWHLLEQPFLSLKRLFPSGRPAGIPHVEPACAPEAVGSR